MEEVTDITEIMGKIGSWVGAAQVSQHGEDLWIIVLDEDFVIEIEQDVDRQMLVLSVSLGEARADGRSDTHDLLLRVNARWRDTGGIRFGLDGPDDELVLNFDVPIEGLDTDGLGTRLFEFTDAALGWREFVAGKGNNAEPDEKALESMIKI